MELCLGYPSSNTARTDYGHQIHQHEDEWESLWTSFLLLVRYYFNPSISFT